MNAGSFKKQFDAMPGDRYGHRVIVREIDKDVRGARRVVVRCELCGEEQVTRFHVLRDGADACLRCANRGYQTHMARFWARAIPEPNSGCWLWTGRVDGKGYGMFMIDSSNRRAHRLALSFSGVDVPHDRIVCHRCDNPPCVNPEHLYVGTDRDNVNDRESRKRGGGPKRRGEGNGRAKLTQAQVEEIRALFETGLHTKVALGKRFGVSDAQIGYIVRRLQW
jgi:hypothetical protein